MNVPEGWEDLRDPLAFCGRVPWSLIRDLAEGDDIAACYLVRESKRLQTRAGQPYIRLLLGDRTGVIEGVIWEEIERWEAVCVPRTPVGVRGRVSFYQQRPQLRITAIEAIRASAAEMEYLIPASRRDRDLMNRELDAHIASVRDPGLRALLRRCLGRDSALGRAFREHPAATRNHHAYLYGLLEHTLSVTVLCARLAEHYQAQGIDVDRDLLIAGALLHDIGKVRELEPLPAPAYTTSGRLLGHIVQGMQIVEREAGQVTGLEDEKLLLVQHLIASHQGKPEWDSPRVPQVIEAIILHYADDLDAKMNQATEALSGVEPGSWSEYDRSLGRALYRPEVRTAQQSAGAGKHDDDVIDLFRG